MKIYTSYFGNYRNFPADSLPVAVCQYPPRGFKGPVIKSLAPSPELLKATKTGEIDEAKYTDIYTREILQPTTPETIRAGLFELGHGADIVLLCYERPESFCHRHLLARWIGPEVKEL